MTVFLLLLQVCDWLLCDEMKPDRSKKGGRQLESWGGTNILKKSNLCPCRHTYYNYNFDGCHRSLSLLFSTLFSFSLCSAASLSLSSALYISSFLSPPPPTRAPSPLFSRRLISGAASQQEYLRKEKAPLLYSLFLSPLSYISLCSHLLLSPIFFSL